MRDRAEAIRLRAAPSRQRRPRPHLPRCRRRRQRNHATCV